MPGQPPAPQAPPFNPKFTFSDSGTPTPLTGTTQDFIITIAPATPISFTGTVPATGTYNVAYTGSASGLGRHGRALLQRLGRRPAQI